ncbi:hypothetical protein GGR53DRAFT_381858 [Hypoxylon sp. FL1150]|nr:hypothetical protein GGR53DRAFT_381858 [Hypoxylon sp. FL1150]
MVIIINGSSLPYGPRLKHAEPGMAGYTYCNEAAWDFDPENRTSFQTGESHSLRNATCCGRESFLGGTGEGKRDNSNYYSNFSRQNYILLIFILYLSPPPMLLFILYCQKETDRSVMSVQGVTQLSPFRTRDLHECIPLAWELPGRGVSWELSSSRKGPVEHMAKVHVRVAQLHIVSLGSCSRARAVCSVADEEAESGICMGNVGTSTFVPSLQVITSRCKVGNLEVWDY